MSTPRTVDVERREVEATIATSAPVPMPDVANPSGTPGPWREVLDMRGLDPARLGIAPVLRRHRSTAVEDQIGAIVAHRVEGERLIATLRFRDTPEADAIWRGITGGTLRGVSIGYSVSSYRRGPVASDGGAPIFVAERWQPFEATVVAIAADPQTGFRAADDGAALYRTATLTSLPRPAGAAGRAAPTPAPETPMTELPSAPHPLDRAAALAPVLDLARKMMPETAIAPVHQRALAEGWDEARLRDALWAAHLAAAPRPSLPASPMTHERAPMERMREAMAEALACRVTRATPSERAREWMGASVPELARELLAAAGERDRTLLRSEGRAVERAMHTTSDFPLLLTGTTNRILLDGYERARAAIRDVCRIRTDIRDFRDINVIGLAGVSRLEQVREGGEIQASTAFEQRETYRVATFARLFNLSRQALINDDLGAFTAAGVLGAAAAETEAAEIVALLGQNSGAGPNLRDGQPLFRTASSNLAGAGTALDVPAVGAAVMGMRRQTDAAGNLVNVDARTLLVGPAAEMQARLLLGSVQNESVANGNPFTGAFGLVVEPRLTGNAWYIFADPTRVPVLELAYLAGSGGAPQIESFPLTPERLGVQMRVIHDFGIGVVGRAGCWRNPGT